MIRHILTNKKEERGVLPMLKLDLLLLELKYLVDVFVANSKRKSLNDYTLDELLTYITWDEDQLLDMMEKSDVLSHYDSDDLLDYLDKEDILNYLDDDDMLDHIDICDVLDHYDSDDIMGGLDIDDMLDYVRNNDGVSRIKKYIAEYDYSGDDLDVLLQNYSASDIVEYLYDNYDVDDIVSIRNVELRPSDFIEFKRF